LFPEDRRFLRRLSAVRRDDGSYSVEAIVILPLIFLTIFAIFQIGLLFVARNTARRAANEAVLIATVEGGSMDAARAEGKARLDRAQGGGTMPLLSDYTVDVSQEGDTVTAVVRGHAVSLVPGIPMGVTMTATGQDQGWVPEP